MATLKTYYKKGNKRADETWNIVIGFTHNGKLSFMPTTTYAPQKDMATSFKIKSTVNLDKRNDRIEVYRELADTPCVNAARC